MCARQGDGKQGQPIDTTRLMVRARVREHPPRLTQPSSLGPEDRDEYLHWLGTFEALFIPTQSAGDFGEIGSFGKS